MTKTLEQDFLSSIPDAATPSPQLSAKEQSFLSGIPDTPDGLASINQSTSVQQPPNALNLNNENFQIASSSPSAVKGISPVPPPVAPNLPEQLASSLYTPVLKYGGMAAGAAAGDIAGGGITPAALATVPALAGLGYAAGANLSDYLDSLIGLKKKTDFFGIPSKEQVTSNIQETAQRIKEGAETELGGRIGGAAISAGLSATMTGARVLATKGPEYIAAIRETAQKLGINLTPAEIVGSRALSMMEHILDNLPWTSGIIQRYRLGEMQKLNGLRDKLIEEGGSSQTIEELGIQVKNLADKFSQKIGLVNKEAQVAMKNRLLEKLGSRATYEDLDISAKEAVQRHQQELSDQVSSAYSGIGKKVDDIIGPQGATPQNTIQAAKKVIAEQESVAPGARNSALLNVAKSLVQDQSSVPSEVAQMYATATPQIKASLEAQFPELLNPSIQKTYQSLDNNIKALNIKKYEQVNNQAGAYQISNAGRQWDDLIQAMKQDRNAMAVATGDSELAKAHETADILFQKKLALFKDPAFKAINNKYPGAIAKTILESGSPELIDRYQSLVGPELANKAKDRLTNDILGLGKDETVVGDSIRKKIADLGTGATSIYSSQELQHFQDIANAVDLREGYTEKLLKNPLFKQIITKGETVPEKLAGNIITPNNIGRAKVMERYVGKEGVKKIADAWLPQLLATNQATGDFRPQTFAKTFDEYGYDTIESWYGKDFANKLKEVATVGRQLGGAESLAGNPSGTGRFMISYYETKKLASQIGKAVTGLAGGAGGAGALGLHPALALGGDGALILGSRQLAKLYLSPAGRKLFVDGLMTPLAAKESGAISGKILSIIGNELRKGENE